MAVTVTPAISTQTVYQQTAPNEYLFPGLCRKQNGDFLLVARKASGHLVADGQLVMRTSPTGLTGSWSAETVLMSPGNTAAGIPRLLDDGRVVIMTWYNVGGTAPWHTTTLLSTDETCTAWTQGGELPDQAGGGAAWGGNACECPVVVLPDGTWLLATYAPEASGDCTWSALLYKSVDEGASWTFVTYIDRADVTGPRLGNWNYEEPFLLLLDNGEILAAVRTAEYGWDGAVGRYTHIYRSSVDDYATTWTSEGRLNSDHQHASRMAMVQTPGGTVLLHHRLLYYSAPYVWSGRGAYYFSEDRGASWNAGAELDSNTSPPAANPTSPPMYSYGDAVLIDGGVAFLWADETPISGSGSAIQFKTYTISGEPPPPPSITGSDVAGITESAATIIGNVNPNGAATSYHVEYGETTGYGSETSPVSAGSGSSPVAVEVDLTGLDPDTGYHARLVAVSANGTTSGPDVPFTTDALPLPGVTGSDVADITLTGASIVANVNPNGAATTYRVEYGETTGYGSNTDWASAGSGSSPVAVEVPLTGLDIDTGYHARVQAQNAGGTTNGPDIPFTTLAISGPLVLDSSSVWQQTGTQITATVFSERRSVIGAVAYSEGGGQIIVRDPNPDPDPDADADRFDIDENPVLPTLEAGVPLDLDLGITPLQGDGQITVLVGIPD